MTDPTIDGYVGVTSRDLERRLTNRPVRQMAELKVFITTRDSSCDECGENLGRGAWILLVEDRKALCLACADLDHLLFLPSGGAALTRRARKHSTLTAVVGRRWSDGRQGLEYAKRLS